MDVTWRGTLPYRQAWAEQVQYREEVIAGRAGPALWLLEHPPVITTGRRDAAVDEVRVREAGFELCRTERGGLATCHEPGQLVGYVFVDVSAGGIRALVAALERGIAAWLEGVGVRAGPRSGHPGVWVGTDKVCALGLHVHRGVTMHGFALNLVNDLRGFGLITPCGILDGGVTTVARLVVGAPTPAEAAPGVGRAVAASVGRFRLDSPGVHG